jgi:hypothetical protein
VLEHKPIADMNALDPYEFPVSGTILPIIYLQHGIFNLPFHRNKAASAPLQLHRSHQNKNGGTWAANYARNAYGVRVVYITAGPANARRPDQCNISCPMFPFAFHYLSTIIY